MRILAILLGLLAVAPPWARGASTPDAAACVVSCMQAAIDALAARGITLDSNTACRAAVLAAARSADPRAELLYPADQVATPASSVEKAEEWTGGVRYLKLRATDADASTNVEERVNAWLLQQCTGLILDLRNAAGSNLAAVDRMTSFFTGDTGALYVVRSSRNPPETHAGASPSRWRAAVPLLVLTDGDTRDGSELLASLLRGRSGIMLIGEATRGDAAAREVVRWGEHEGLWIATGRIELPQGPAYDPGGVTPDVFIEKGADSAPQEKLPEETATGRPLSARAREDRALLHRTDGDAALRRALEILLALKAVRVQTK